MNITIRIKDRKSGDYYEVRPSDEEDLIWILDQDDEGREFNIYLFESEMYEAIHKYFKENL